MFCTQCGTENPENAKFCFRCGTAIAGEMPSSPAPALTIPPPAMPAVPPAPVPAAAPSPSPAAALEYAGFWRRFAAFVAIDLPISLLVIGFFDKRMRFPEGPHPGKGLAVVLVLWLYFALMESSGTQGTLGKMAVGLKVTDQSGRRIGFGRATGRFFGKLLSTIIFCIGHFMAGFTAKKQALHDLMAGTLVLVK